MEISLTLIIIAVIITAVGIARDAKQDADMTYIYKRVVEPCVTGAVMNMEPTPKISSCVSIANGVAKVAHTDAEALREMALERLSSDFSIGPVDNSEITAFFEITVLP